MAVDWLLPIHLETTTVLEYKVYEQRKWASDCTNDICLVAIMVLILNTVVYYANSSSGPASARHVQ